MSAGAKTERLSFMKTIKQADVLHVKKPEGTEVWYYLFDEYEIHYNEQRPGTTQTWHHHERIWETLYIIEGELTAQWREYGKLHKRVVRAGDVIETENTPHTFTNHTEKPAKFLVLKQKLSGENKRAILEGDKFIDHA